MADGPNSINISASLFKYCLLGMASGGNRASWAFGFFSRVRAAPRVDGLMFPPAARAHRGIRGENSCVA